MAQYWSLVMFRLGRSLRTLAVVFSVCVLALGSAFLIGKAAQIDVGYFLKEILSGSDFPILAVSAVFYAISMGMDKLLPSSDTETFIENGCKLIGIAFLLTYLTRTCIQMTCDHFLFRQPQVHSPKF
jgi:hypothetical protein